MSIDRIAWWCQERSLAGLLTAIVMVLAVAGHCRAEVPDVKFLFPAGVQQGQTRAIQVHGKPGTLPVRVWTSDERLSAAPDEKGEQITLSAKSDMPPGLYWVRVVNDEGASELLPVVVGVLSEVTEEQLQTDKGSQPPMLPTTISGVLSKSGEVDAYAVRLDAGQTLIASVDSRRLLASPADVVLQLADERGFVVAQNDDHHEIDPQIVYMATADGAYTVRVFAFPADPNSTIRFAGGDNYVYRLTLTTGPFVDHLFPMALRAESETALAEYGWNLPDDEPPVISSAGSDETIGTTLRYPGSLLVNRLPTMTVPLTTEPPAVAGSDPLTLPIPGAVCGHIASNAETDVYRFAAKKDQTLRMSVAAQAFDSPLDPVLTIRDAAGKLFKQADDVAKGNADIRIDVKFPADGDYTARVTDRYAHGGMRYVYLLSIDQPRPEYRLALKASWYTVPAEKPLEIPVAIERHDGFDGAITVRIEGLPDGVTAAPVESAAKGETAKSVTLKVETDGKEAYGGPITIVGTGGDAPPVRALLETPVAGLQTNDLWLSVIAAKKQEPQKDNRE